MTCRCDLRIWPPTLDIAAGLDDLPRQLVDFRDLRLAMFDRARWQPALARWGTRSSGDYGVMICELWAYVGELLSIYDKAIADESYVRTAKLRPSLRRSTALLGYVPRPAVAASAEIAILADGAKPIALPIGTGFTSGAFDGEPPQTFELVAPATIHAALNSWPLAAPIATHLKGTTTSLLFEAESIRFNADDHLAISFGGADPQVRKVLRIERVIDAGRRLARAVLDRPLDAGAAGVPVDQIRARRGTRRARMHFPESPGPSVSITSTKASFILDGVFAEAQSGGTVLVERDGEARWMVIDERGETNVAVGADHPAFEITVPGGTVKVPIIQAALSPCTQIVGNTNLDARSASATSPAWIGKPAAGFTIHLPLVDAGHVVGGTRTTLEPGDPLIAEELRAPIGSSATTTRLALRDVEATSVVIGGSVDWSIPTLKTSPGATWQPLAVPVEAFGNVVTVVRGETVDDEVLGAGDATAVFQAFTLAKKPLTYVNAPASESGVRSTLRVWVDGLEWYEVPTFFGQPADAPVFIVRQNDAGDSIITFGDGKRGGRLPTGGTVAARYRFGAGAKAPPSGSIANVAKPVVGLRSVVGVEAASGGADPESVGSLRSLAPRSALLLGRAISIDDMEVAARLVPDVVTARAEWQWDGRAQRPVVKVWYVGAVDLATTVAARLRGLADPSTPIAAAVASAIVVPIAIDIEIDPRRIPTDVLAAVGNALQGDGGALTPAVLGIGRPLLRSPLVRALFDVPGVTGVRSILWNGAPLLEYGVDPGVGAYFELSTSLAITGS